MYFGSVKFFKHLIYLCIVLISFLTVVGLITVITWCIPNNDKDVEENHSASIDNKTTANEANNPDNTGTEDSNSGNTDYTDITNPNENIISEDTENEHAKDVVNDSEISESEHKKMAYLTIDDGPSVYTEEILDFLDDNNIKATFFIVTGYKSDLSILNEIIDRGHSIGLHSDSHDYSKIYESVESFLEDIDTEKEIIKEETGIEPKIIRLPGGSINSHNINSSAKILEKLQDDGYKIFDWNVSLQDAQDITSDEMLDFAEASYKLFEGENLYILSHDCKYSDRTIKALEVFIKKLQNDGYTFTTLDENVDSLMFTYK